MSSNLINSLTFNIVFNRFLNFEKCQYISELSVKDLLVLDTIESLVLY